MKEQTKIQFYSPTEEKLNIWSHAVGIFFKHNCIGFTDYKSRRTKQYMDDGEFSYFWD